MRLFFSVVSLKQATKIQRCFRKFSPTENHGRSCFWLQVWPLLSTRWLPLAKRSLVNSNNVTFGENNSNVDNYADDNDNVPVKSSNTDSKLAKVSSQPQSPGQQPQPSQDTDQQGENKQLVQKTRGKKAHSRWDVEWGKALQSLKVFVNEHGHAMVPKTYERDPSLRNWLDLQRRRYRKNTLGPDQQEQLEQLGMIWNVREDQWDHKFQEYVQFSKQHGHLDMALAPVALASWCNKQRVYYGRFMAANKDGNSAKQTTITEERIEKLNAIGFPWDIHDAYWYGKYKELMLYRQIHGNCVVPYEYNPTLMKWIDDQRTQYRRMIDGDKKSNMTTSRVKLLNMIDFIWDPREYKWNVRYEELVDHMAKTHLGHIPARSSPLGRWVQYQKRLYNEKRNGNEDVGLTDDRITKLRALRVLGSGE